MKVIWLAMYGLLTGLLLSGCGGGSADGDDGGSCGYSSCSSLAGLPYVVYQPTGYDGSQPMLVLLHGAGVGRDATEAMWHGRELADSDQLLLVIPSAGTWNYGSDIQFVADLIDQVRIDHGAGSEVFVAGWSNGSQLSQLVACDQSQAVTGVISFAGQMVANRACEPNVDVAVALIHHSGDAVVPIGGGAFGTLSLNDNFALWRQLNGCSDTTNSSEPFPLEANNDAVTTWAEDCRVPVEMTVLSGGAHQAHWQPQQIHRLLRDFMARTRAARAG